MGSQDMAPGTSAEDKFKPDQSLFQKVGGAVKGMMKFSGLAKFGLLAVLSQSKLATGVIGTIFRLLGALVDIFLAFFIPFLIDGIKGLSRIVKSIWGFLNGLVSTFKAAWNAVWDWLTGLADSVRVEFLDLLGTLVNKLGIQTTVADTFFGEGVTTANPAINESVVDDWANGKNAGGNLISAEDKAGVEQDLEDAREALAGGEEDATEPEAEVPWYGQRASEYYHSDLSHQLNEENFDENMDLVENGEVPVTEDDLSEWWQNSWTETFTKFGWDDVRDWIMGNTEPDITPQDVFMPNGPVNQTGEEVLNDIMGTIMVGPPASSDEVKLYIPTESSHGGGGPRNVSTKNPNDYYELAVIAQENRNRE